MRIPRRKTDTLKRGDEEPLYLTEDGFRKLQERLARMKKAAPELAAEAARTAAYGDRSDNAEYKEAKRILRGTNYGIFAIESQLKRAVIIKPGRNAAGTVQLGSKVVLEFESKSASVRKTFEIVGPHETDPARGRISHESPLGAALIGHAANDKIILKTPNGSQTYRIVEVS